MTNSELSQVKSYLRCKYSAVKHISIDKAWNKTAQVGRKTAKAVT